MRRPSALLSSISPNPLPSETRAAKVENTRATDTTNAMKSPTDYISQPTEDRYDAWAVLTAGNRELVMCGRPESLRECGYVVLCSAEDRAKQLPAAPSRLSARSLFGLDRPADVAKGVAG